MNTKQSLQELAHSRFILFWAVSLLVGMLNAPVNSLLPVYMEAESQASPLLSAGLRSTFLLLGGFFAVPAGYLCDRLGVRTTYVIGVSGTVAAGAVFLTQDVTSLFLLCVYIGVATGISTTAGQAYLIHATPRASMGLGSAAYFLGMTLGSAVGNRLTGEIAEGYGFKLVGLSIIVGAVVITVLMALVLPELERPTRSSQEPKLRSLDLLRRREIRLLLAVRFLPTCYWGAATLLIPLLIYRTSESLSSAANYSAFSLVIASIGQVSAGRLADKYGARIPTLIASSLVAISAIGTGIWVDSTGGLYLFGTLGAVSAWSVSTMMPRLIDSVSSMVERGRVVGTAHFAWSLGMLIGSLWAGRAVEWDPRLPFLSLAVGCVVTVALFVALFRRLDVLERQAASKAAIP